MTLYSRGACYDFWLNFAGEIIGCRVSDPLSSPYIQSVRPLAIMSGQRTSLVVTGLNLTKTGTRYVCVVHVHSHMYVRPIIMFVKTTYLGYIFSCSVNVHLL